MQEVCAPSSPSDALENITWTPVAASLGLLEGEKAAATDDLEALFLSLYYIVTGGHILGRAAFSSRNVSEMAAARRGSMFVSRVAWAGACEGRFGGLPYQPLPHLLPGWIRWQDGALEA